jgi:hypothetical protein
LADASAGRQRSGHTISNRRWRLKAEEVRTQAEGLNEGERVTLSFAEGRKGPEATWVRLV